MKTQEELNNDYDKIMIEFQQKYFIESSLKIERRYDEKDIGNVFNKFSNYFNEEYQHIYLKPLLLLNKDPRNNDKTSFLNAVENLPSTFFNTAMGEEFVISHSHAFARNLLLLPITEEREAMLFHKKHLEDPYRESFETLSKNEQINIQENLSDFVDIFLHSDKYPESIKHKCCNILLNEIKDFVSGNNNSYSNPFKLNKFKHTDFLIDVFQSIEFQNPFKELNANFFQREFNSSRKPFSI